MRQVAWSFSRLGRLGRLGLLVALLPNLPVPEACAAVRLLDTFHHFVATTARAPEAHTVDLLATNDVELVSWMPVESPRFALPAILL